MSGFKPYYGDTPYPIANAGDVTLPVAEVTLATMYVCHSCMGYRLDVESAKNNPGVGLVPCTRCGNRGAVLPGETMFVDVTASHSWELGKPSLDLGRVYCLARLRSPWPGRGGWYAEPRAYAEEVGMPLGTHSESAFGVNALRRAAEVAAINAAEGAGGMRIRSIRFLADIVWPSAWPISRRAMDARQKILAEIDMPASKVVRG